MESRTNDVAEGLLRCPVGCAFLLTIVRDKVPVTVAATPQQAFGRAVAALRALNPWMNGFDRVVSAVLSKDSNLALLAREVAAHPGIRWWTDPIDHSRQVLISNDEMECAPSRRLPPESVAHWEAYAQRPLPWRITSTIRGKLSCLDTVIATGSGDWMEPASYRRYAAVIDETARVFEISGPADWHELCISFPSVNQDRNSPAGAGSLSPDWKRVAEEWDGVHLTFAGLLTTPFVRHNSAAGSTMLWSWDTEGTLWLPGEFLRAGAPLGAVDRDACGPEVTAPLRDDKLGISEWPPDEGRIIYRA